MMGNWEEALWSELDAKPETEQITLISTWITEIVQDLLPALGQRRREVIDDVVRQEGWDATRLAETIGTRRSTILRLAQEGRRTKREAV